MTRNSILKAAGVVLCGGALAAPGAGLWLYEKGNPDNMTAVAGRAALAADASTTMGNPAGMTRLQKPELLLGIQPMYMDAQFDSERQTTMSGDDGGQAGGFLPGMSFYYVHPLSENWRLGFGSTSTYGAALDYGDDFVGRYTTMNVSLLTVSAGPSVAYRVTKELSVGVGGFVTYAKLDGETAVPNLRGGDGKVNLEDETLGYGGNAGILFEPLAGTRFGLTYFMPVKLKFEDVLSSEGLDKGWQWLLGRTGLAGANTDLTITMPQGVMFSAYQELSEKWAVVGNLGWQDSSAGGKMDVEIDGDGVHKDTTVDAGWNDTYHFALGARYKINEQWLWGFGMAYDTSPCDEDSRNVMFPLDRQIRYATGVQYAVNEKHTLGLAYTFVDLGKAEIDQAYPGGKAVSGEYSSNYLHIVTLSYSVKF